MKFKDRLRFLREEANNTHSQIAAMLGKSEGAVRSWETGRAIPDINTLVVLADHFSVSTDYLLGRSDNSYAFKRVEEDCWENIFMHVMMKELIGLFTKYNRYKGTNPPVNLDNVFLFSIRGDFRNMLEKHKTFLDHLINIQEYKTMQEVDNLVDEYLGNLGQIRIGDHMRPDGSWDKEITDYDLELWLRDELEKAIPGYRDYRNMTIKEWVKRGRSEGNERRG